MRSSYSSVAVKRIMLRTCTIKEAKVKFSSAKSISASVQYTEWASTHRHKCLHSGKQIKTCHKVKLLSGGKWQC